MYIVREIKLGKYLSVLLFLQTFVNIYVFVMFAESNWFYNIKKSNLFRKNTRQHYYFIHGVWISVFFKFSDFLLYDFVLI